MQKILVRSTDKGLRIESDYNKALIKQLVKEGTTLFELRPRKMATRKQVGYLEGAVIFSWAKYQYDLDPRNPENHELARNLFKQDFWHDIIKDRNGQPKKVIKSLKGQHSVALDKYLEIAPENGYPIPNPDLYKKWRDEYSMELKWDNYYDWLDYLGLEDDAMPSAEAFNKL